MHEIHFNTVFLLDSYLFCYIGLTVSHTIQVISDAIAFLHPASQLRNSTTTVNIVTLLKCVATSEQAVQISGTEFEDISVSVFVAYEQKGHISRLLVVMSQDTVCGAF